MELPLVAALLTCLAPDPSRLGVDDWHEREVWMRRYDNPLSALLLPDTHADPEIAHRLKALKAKNLREFCPRYREAKLHRDDFPAWVQRHVIESDSLAFSLADVFHELHTDGDKADVFFKLAPHCHTNQSFLRGAFVDGEYQTWREHVARHRYPNVCGVAESVTNGVIWASLPVP